MGDIKQAINNTAAMLYGEGVTDSLAEYYSACLSGDGKLHPEFLKQLSNEKMFKLFFNSIQGQGGSYQYDKSNIELNKFIGDTTNTDELYKKFLSQMGVSDTASDSDDIQDWIVNICNSLDTEIPEQEDVSNNLSEDETDEFGDWTDDLPRDAGDIAEDYSQDELDFEEDELTDGSDNSSINEAESNTTDGEFDSEEGSGESWEDELPSREEINKSTDDYSKYIDKLNSLLEEANTAYNDFQKAIEYADKSIDDEDYDGARKQLSIAQGYADSINKIYDKAIEIYDECSENTNAIGIIDDVSDINTEVDNKLAEIKIKLKELLDTIQRVKKDAEKATQNTKDNLSSREDEYAELNKCGKDLIEFIKNNYDSAIRGALNRIEHMMTLLYSSGYDVESPEGLLCNGKNGGAVLTFEKGNYEQAVYKENMQYRKLYKALIELTNIKESNERFIDYGELVSGVNYYPKKLLEYAFGRWPLSDKEARERSDNMLYKKHASSASWKLYFDNVIKKELKTKILKIIAKYFEASQLEIGDIEKGDAIIDDILNTIVNAYIPSMVVIKDDSGEIKIRVADHLRIIDNQKIDQMKQQLLSIYNGGDYTIQNEADRVFCDIRSNGEVKEFRLIRNGKMAGAVPLFAYQALEKLIEKGKGYGDDNNTAKVNWDNIILGKNTDESIYIGNNPSMNNRFNLANKTLVHVSAGSRSGKGVMTLNLLASAYASGLPVFYLDCKPDMSSLLKYIARKNGVDTFAINAANMDPKADMGNVMASNPANIILPPEIPKSTMSDLEWEAIKYIKTANFMLWLMVQAAQNVISVGNPKQNVIMVVDELQKALGKWQSAYLKLHAISRYNSDIKGKDKQTPKAQVAGQLISWYYSICKDLESASKSSTKNITPTMFVIYQEHKPSTWNAGGLTTKSDGSFVENTMFYRSLTTIGKAGFIGYDQNNSQPIHSLPGVGQYISGAARYFAFVDDIDNQKAGYDLVKPYLILNDVNNENDPNSYVGELKKQLKSNNMEDDDIREILNRHRVSEGGQLNPAMGFEGYISMLGENLGAGFNFPSIMKQSHDIFVNVINQLGYDGDNPYDFLSDFRPEWMLTWDEMTAKVKGEQPSGQDYRKQNFTLLDPEAETPDEYSETEEFRIPIDEIRKYAMKVFIVKLRESDLTKEQKIELGIRYKEKLNDAEVLKSIENEMMNI